MSRPSATPAALSVLFSLYAFLAMAAALSYPIRKVWILRAGYDKVRDTT